MCNIPEERRSVERSAEHTGTHAKKMWVGSKSMLATGDEKFIYFFKKPIRKEIK